MNEAILVIDDDEAMCETLERALARRGFRAVTATSGAEAKALLVTNDFEVVLTDLRMRGGVDGLDLCRHVAANRPDLPVVIVTAFGSMEAAVGAIRAGAYDFVTKPFELDSIAQTVERAVADRRLRDEVKPLRSGARGCDRLGMVGESAPMKEVYDLVARVAETEATVLVTGESGTGKELVAKAIHACSHRKNGPFVAVNCAAVPETLLESELFGHTKGAFTDARQARQGLFLTSRGGTLFLDEIGEMALGIQAKLLRVLQERVIRPVGGDQEIPFDTRLVAATNRDLESTLAERRFREDLFYRINVVRIHVPALREKRGDIVVLAQHFVEQFASVHRATVKGLSPEAAERLAGYPWPGNVRELQNCIERAVALAQGEILGTDDLPDKIREYRPLRVVVEAEVPKELLPMSEVERRYVLRVLESVGGNKTLAAQRLGFDRRTLYRKLERYGGTEPLSSRPTPPGLSHVGSDVGDGNGSPVGSAA
jgi:two-component system response regulator AtoC